MKNLYANGLLFMPYMHDWILAEMYGKGAIIHDIRFRRDLPLMTWALPQVFS